MRKPNYVLMLGIFLGGFVSMGFIDELPVGVSFFGRAWSEPVLLEIAYGFEQGTRHRRVPKYLVTDPR